MNMVYIVLTCYDYESSWIVKVFSDKEAAEEFAKRYAGEGAVLTQWGWRFSDYQLVWVEEKEVDV